MSYIPPGPPSAIAQQNVSLSLKPAIPIAYIREDLRINYMHLSQSMDELYALYCKRPTKKILNTSEESEPLLDLSPRINEIITEINSILTTTPDLLPIMLNEAMSRGILGLAEFDPALLKKMNAEIKKRNDIKFQSSRSQQTQPIPEITGPAFNDLIKDLTNTLNFTADKEHYPWIKDKFNTMVMWLSVLASVNGGMGGIHFFYNFFSGRGSPKFVFMTFSWLALAANFFAAKAPAKASWIGYFFAALFAIPSAFLSWTSANTLPSEFTDATINTIGKLVICLITVIPNFICNVGLDGRSLSELVNSMRLLRGIWNAASTKGKLWLAGSRIGMLIACLITLIPYYIGGFNFLTEKISNAYPEKNDVAIISSTIISSIVSFLGNLGMLSMLFNLSFRRGLMLNQISDFIFSPPDFFKLLRSSPKDTLASTFSPETFGRIFFGAGGAMAFVGLGGESFAKFIKMGFCLANPIEPPVHFPPDLNYTTLCLDNTHLNPAQSIIAFTEVTTGYSLQELWPLLTLQVQIMLWIAIVFVGFVSFSNYERLWYSILPSLDALKSGLLCCVRKKTATLPLFVAPRINSSQPSPQPPGEKTPPSTRKPGSNPDSPTRRGNLFKPED